MAAKTPRSTKATGKALLASYGVAVPKTTVVQGHEEVEHALQTLKLPVVVKVVSAEILHKSDAGGVRINLNSVDEVRDAIRAMSALPKIKAARVEGWLIEEMAPAGQEMVVGGLRDPQFGPLVMVGLGGIFVEVLADVSFRICPITRLDAEEMLDDLKGSAILKGARGRKAVSRDAIVDVLLKIGGENGLLMQHAEDIREADINPLIVTEAGAVAVDARFILSGERTGGTQGSSRYPLPRLLANKTLLPRLRGGGDGGTTALSHRPIHAALRPQDRRGDRRVDQRHGAAERLHPPHPRIRFRGTGLPDSSDCAGDRRTACL